MITFLVLSKFWYSNHEVENQVEGIFSDIFQLEQHVKNVDIEVESEKIYWWLVEEKPLDVRLEEFPGDLLSYRFKLLDRSCKPIESRPDPHGNFKPKDHRDTCGFCFRDTAILPVAKRVGLKGSLADLMDDIQLTGRRAPNGHEVAVNISEELYYVSQKGLEFFVTKDPGGKVTSKYEA